jgi:cold shock CspA family protein
MIRLGEVTAFDDARGLGTVRDDEGREELAFHCTEIAGGTRTIAIGTRVAFEVVPARLGRREARSLQPLAGAGG